MFKNQGHTTIILLCICILSSCAPVLKGPVFLSAPSVPENKGHVYIYWTGVPPLRLTFQILANNIAITTMKSGGYYLYEAEPGPMVLTSSTNFTYGQMGVLDLAMTGHEKLNLRVNRGKQLFVRGNLIGRQGTFKLLMQAVDRKRGLYELRNAKLLSRYEPTPTLEPPPDPD